MAVEDAAVGEQDLEQRDAAAVGRVGVADAHALGRADSLAAAAVALARPGRGAGGVVFGRVGEDGELLLEIELGHQARPPRGPKVTSWMRNAVFFLIAPSPA